MDANTPEIVGGAMVGSSMVSYLIGRCRGRLCQRTKKKSSSVPVRPVAVVNCDEIVEAVFKRLSAERESAIRRQQGVDTSTEAINKTVTKFFVSSQFLIQSFRCLLKSGERHGQFRESFHYATGLQVGAESFAITQILPVEFAEQSAAGVRVADESSIAAFSRLDHMGTALIAHFHSHPGHGKTANFPSTTDLCFQERLERGGHVAIGGIFARGTNVAYVRFFAGEGRQFEVNVHGSFVERMDDHVFKLALADGPL